MQSCTYLLVIGAIVWQVSQATPAVERRKRQTEACGSNVSDLTGEKPGQLVERHNYYRSEENATDEYKLEWDDGLAARAQQWAEECNWAHGMTTDCDGNPIGQNLYFAAGSNDFPQMNIDNIVKAWADEKIYYHLESKSCDAGKMCGHYTQVVWAETTKVGCGFAECATMSQGDDPAKYKNAVLFACDYSPAGNYVGESPYGKGISCAACRYLIGGKSGWICDDNLCSPCTPEIDGNKCKCSNNQANCLNGGIFNAATCTCDCTAEYFGHYCEHECKCLDATGYADACQSWKNADFCAEDSVYRAYMMNTCPATCGTCTLPDSCPSTA